MVSSFSMFSKSFLFPPFSIQSHLVRLDQKDKDPSRLLPSSLLKYALRFYYMAASVLRSRLHGLAHNRRSISDLIDEWMSSEMK